MEEKTQTARQVKARYGTNLKVDIKEAGEWVEKLSGIEFDYRIKNQHGEKEEINDADPIFVGWEWKHSREFSAVIFPKDGEMFEIDLGRVDLTSSDLYQGRADINTVAKEIQAGEQFRYLEVLKNLKKSGVEDITKDAPNREDGVIESLADDKEMRQMLRDWSDIISIIKKEKLKKKKIEKREEKRKERQQAVESLSKRIMVIPKELTTLYKKTRISMKNLNHPKSETPRKNSSRKI